MRRVVEVVASNVWIFAILGVVVLWGLRDGDPEAVGARDEVAVRLDGGDGVSLVGEPLGQVVADAAEHVPAAQLQDR